MTGATTAIARYRLHAASERLISATHSADSLIAMAAYEPIKSHAAALRAQLRTQLTDNLAMIEAARDALATQNTQTDAEYIEIQTAP